MHTIELASSHAPRDAWKDACGATAFVSFLVILGHVLSPQLTGFSIPYSGGAAVVLGIGATVCLVLKARGARLAAAAVLGGLLGLRALSALAPNLLIAKHGALSWFDGAAFALLALAFLAMLSAAWSRADPGSSMPPRGASPASE